MNLYSYILLAIAIAIFFRYKWQKQKLLKRFTTFHTMPAQPLVGHVKYLSSNMNGRFGIIRDRLRPCRYPAVAWIFNIPLVILESGVDIQTVLNKSDDKGIYNKLKNILRGGLLAKTGERWRKSRRIANPIFSASMMRRYLTAFNQHSAGLIRKLESFANTYATFDLQNYILYTSLDIIFDNMADYQLKTLQDENAHIIRVCERTAELDSMRYTQPLLYLDFMYNAYLYVTGQWKIFEEMNEFFTNIVRKRMDHYKLNESYHNDGIHDIGTEKVQHIPLDTLIKAHHSDPEYTFESMKDDFLNIVLAGSVTTARTICFALLMLAIHQDVQEELYKEIKAIFGNTGRPVEMDDLNKLVYLDQCIKETLRKYPLIAISFRKHSEDIVLNEKQIIPANTDIVIGIYALHHNENIYPKPDSWDPDRFAPEAVAKRDKLSFLPFGIGPQACIGAKYAMISIKTQLVHLLQRYHFDTDMTSDDIQLSIDLTLKSANGYKVKIRRRE